MPGDNEIPILMNAFRGVNLAVDPTYLDDRDLQSSENWLPSDTLGLLTKRRGNIAGPGGLPGTVNFAARLARTYDQASPPNRLLYLVSHESPPKDQIYVSTNDGAFVAVTNGSFTTKGQTYDYAVLGNNIYFGNGVDPLKIIALSAPTVASDFAALAVTNEVGQSATANAATGTAVPLDPGTYSYAWAVYDTSTTKYISRGIPRTVVVQANIFVSFQAPATGLPANQVYKLFVSLRNLPIEFATDQVEIGLAASATHQINNVSVTGTALPVAATVTRTGRFLIAHRARLWLSGDQANKSKLYSTTTIIPGLEQAIFNQGDFFPALAQASIALNDGDEVTGIGVTSLTTTQRSPDAPLAILKTQSSWLLTGNLDDNTGVLVNLSSRIGCISHRTIVNTPIGLVFCGHESVYLLPTDLREPIDIGWPIAPVIKAIPNNVANLCFAFLHDGFYVLFLVPSGFSVVRQSWWLDLRRGQIADPPAWWGPQSHVPATLPSTTGIDDATTGLREIAEDDRAWIAVQGVVSILDQPAIYTELGATIVSRLRTKVHDARGPFDRKVFTGVRVNARVGSVTTINVTTTYDGGMSATPPALVLSGIAVALWDVTWDVTWGGVTLFTEGDTRLVGDVDRAPHRTAMLDLVHGDPIQVDLHDVELRYIPVERKVA